MNDLSMVETDVLLNEIEKRFKSMALKYRHGQRKTLSMKDLDTVLHGIEILIKINKFLNGGVI